MTGVPAKGDLVHCRQCGRKILLERKFSNGVDYTIEIAATCWECLDKKAQRSSKKRYYLTVQV